MLRRSLAGPLRSRRCEGRRSRTRPPGWRSSPTGARSRSCACARAGEAALDTDAAAERDLDAELDARAAPAPAARGDALPARPARARSRGALLPARLLARGGRAADGHQRGAHAQADGGPRRGRSRVSRRRSARSCRRSARGSSAREQESLMRALAFGMLDPDGERHRVALAHLRACPACRRQSRRCAVWPWRCRRCSRCRERESSGWPRSRPGASHGGRAGRAPRRPARPRWAPRQRRAAARRAAAGRSAAAVSPRSSRPAACRARGGGGLRGARAWRAANHGDRAPSAPRACAAVTARQCAMPAAPCRAAPGTHRARSPLLRQGRPRARARARRRVASSRPSRRAQNRSRGRSPALRACLRPSRGSGRAPRNASSDPG